MNENDKFVCRISAEINIPKRQTDRMFSKKNENDKSLCRKSARINIPK